MGLRRRKLGRLGIHDGILDFFGGGGATGAPALLAGVSWDADLPGLPDLVFRLVIRPWYSLGRQRRQTGERKVRRRFPETTRPASAGRSLREFSAPASCMWCPEEDSNLHEVAPAS
ncbi:hypothetical protein OZ12_20350, partial [Xanthomonas translucens pv. translucens]